MKVSRGKNRSHHLAPPGAPRRSTNKGKDDIRAQGCRDLSQCRIGHVQPPQPSTGNQGRGRVRTSAGHATRHRDRLHDVDDHIRIRQSRVRGERAGGLSCKVGIIRGHTRRR